MRFFFSILLLFCNLAYAQTSTFETTEYLTGRFLTSVNASSTYARGYTGKGSTILIIDTGINLTSSEFTNKIVGTIDYTGTGIKDNVGHGSNVASIAAAARDGVGMQGVAYDANLLIAKVTDNNSYSFQNALKAIQWGGNNGAIVANISANEVLSAGYVKYTTQIAPGVFKNTDPVYGGTNYYNLIRPADWAAALKGNNIVLVVSAGNSGRPYPDNPATLATATDASGNLVLGGRMLVVGNWDQMRNAPQITSNLAGTVCKNVVNNSCQDRYRTSDFYIMAPGTSNYGVTTTGYVGMTGTSQAAPVVSGAVAIINQMWPTMTPENIAKLLLVTANKNIANYNVNTMGQGLLDLNRATQPVGTLNIPTTGRSGITAAPVVTSGSVSLAKISSVMVIDSFQRDFYTTGSALTVARSNAEFNVMQTAMPYSTHNNYSLYNNYTDVRSSTKGDLSMRTYLDSSSNHMVELAHAWHFDNTDLTVSGGGFQETGTWLGTAGTNTSYTAYSQFGATTHFDNNQVFATVGYGVTSANSTNALLTVGAVQSYTWNFGIEHQFDSKQSLGVMVSQPVTVTNTQATAMIPVGLDSAGAVKYNSQQVDISPEVKELRLGAYYKTSNLIGFVERRQNYLGQQGAVESVAGVMLNYKF